ncbi:MAG: serine/threonine protein kinase [Lentisphaeria bacterium]|nr:serine/threonine protein kinase [Lentisphaeria bacterium]
MKKQTLGERLLEWLSLNSEEGHSQELDKTLIIEDKDPELSQESVDLLYNNQKRYEVVRLLGRGAFGVVLLARDRIIGRMVAMKQLHQEYAEDGKTLDHFLMEARIAGQLEDANIVKVYDVINSKPPQILMEYLPSGNLADRIRLNAPFGKTEALRICREILSGLEVAHKRNVVHRDLKPENIIFDSNAVPKISDFGVASLPVHGRNYEESLDLDKKNVFGTPNYMAPEQVDDKMVVDFRADLYSVGLILFEMLTGRRLHNFERVDDTSKIYNEIKLNPLPSFHSLKDINNQPIYDVLKALLAFNPDDRPKSTGAALTLVEELYLNFLNRKTLSIPKVIKKSDYNEMYQDILRIFLVDGIINPFERKELEKRAARLAIKPSEAKELEDEVRQKRGLPSIEDLQEFASEAESKLATTKSEESTLFISELGDKLNISETEQNQILSRIKVKLELDKKVSPE